MDILSVLESAFTYSYDSAITFTQLSFWIFFAVLLLGYIFVCHKQHLVKSIYLLVFSLFFYYKSSGAYFFLLLLSTAIDFRIAKIIHANSRQIVRKLLLILSIALNLGLLAYFKYAYFIAEFLNDVFDIEMSVTNIFSQAINMIIGEEAFEIDSLILPVGISFYTFQVLSYTIDVYRKKLTPINNIADFAFYVSFFPQLVAGPIVRASEFIPQIYQKYQLTRQQMWSAVFLIMNGLVKKIVVSDYISLNFVDRVFDDPTLYSGFELLMGVYGYTIQIYCDFSGYTDIAIGVACLLGFHLPINFNSPYKALNIADFWRRWHISLSSWLRDYLYISLGGNRKGKIRTYINLMITMLLGGLWHGASYKFILWGGLHGGALALHRIWHEYCPARFKAIKLPRFVAAFFTFHFVCFAWIFFRAEDMYTATSLLSCVFTQFYIGIIPAIIDGYALIFLLIVGAYIIHFLPANFKDWYRALFIKLPTIVKIIFVICILFFLYQASSADLQPFIYFQF
ncbi:MAG: MBOAT family O-acyltransferase [Bacteroidales bacterium]